MSQSWPSQGMRQRYWNAYSQESEKEQSNTKGENKNQENKNQENKNQENKNQQNKNQGLRPHHQTNAVLFAILLVLIAILAELHHHKCK